MRLLLNIDNDTNSLHGFAAVEYFLNNFYCGGGYFLTFLRGFGII
mgnify:CR=1 FL=1